MSPVIDQQSQLIMGNPKGFSSNLKICPTPNQVNDFMKDMIVSASGWRKIFALSGNEEDSGEDISSVANLVSGIMVYSFIDFFQIEGLKKTSGLSLVIGMDSRPTGPALADPMLRTLISLGVNVEYLFITAAPEIMAYVQKSSHLDGFIYISASHNPVGHNGVKFGLSDGGVIGGEKAKNLIQTFRNQVADPEIHQRVFYLMSHSNLNTLEQILSLQPQCKSQSLRIYQEFTQEVLTDNLDPSIINSRLKQLSFEVSKNQLGIVLEMNGSARSTSIDVQFLQDLGIKVHALNNQPRQIVHRIVPEGRSLDLCKSELLKLQKKDPIFQLGMVPDCDGDRGNLVFFDPKENQVKEIEAQGLFGLLVLSELSWLVFTKQITFSEDGSPHQRVAVVINGPSSRRVEEIADLFGAQVFRAEVGEANVVNLAEWKRSQGWLVRILGEGSNGGNITHPSKVRDPINTIGSIAKLLTLQALKEIAADKLSIDPHKIQSLADYLSALPPYITTSAYEDRAIMKVTTLDHSLLKLEFEQIFLKEWELKSQELLVRFNINSWNEINYEGTSTNLGFGPTFRSGSQRGGLKIELQNKDQQPIAFMWMRGSGTEPVFRILVDVKGNHPELEDYLLTWLRTMIAEADKKHS